MPARLAPDGLTIIDVDECRTLLRKHYLGRLGYVTGERPVIVPVNYRLTIDGDVAVLTAPGAKYEAAARGDTMCLQVDDVDVEYQSAWSVLVTGRSRVIDDESEVEELARQLRLRPWAHAVPQTHLILVHADRIEGRRLH
ncbi:MAG: pyridoxamine 5'-phosphate oxidase family protein [Nitriliruptorales bacterium]|nr:pyridoxamine 5'-phosphate oxidase family protein [Nitriliruptorales bacterium]